MISSLLTASFLVVSAPAIDIDYVSARGLFVKVDGVPLIQGSFFQLYEGNWARGVYSSNWNQQQVKKDSTGTTVTFGSTESPVSGNFRFEARGSEIIATYRFVWRGDKPVNLENTIATLWAVPFEDGHVKVDGVEGRRPSMRLTGSDPDPRVFVGRGSRFGLSGPFADVELSSSVNGARIFDARNYPQDWATGRELFWLGHERLELTPNVPLEYTARIRVDRHPAKPGPRQEHSVSLRRETAIVPETPATLIPKPKKLERLREPAVALPAGILRQGKDIETLLRTRWDAKALKSLDAKVRLDARVADLGLQAEGFRITVAGGSIAVIGQDVAGLRHGLRTVVELAEARNGKLVLPAMELEDYPSVNWRGIHAFVGPSARNFQGRMMDRVLAPLRFNRVVLQCERTDWDTTPGIETPITMSKKDLGGLFDDYRSRGIEPIPLIQSHGHMQWLFANNKNTNLAFNPSVPFAVDPRKPEARTKVERLWDEAITLLKPKTIHFGMDEINLRGGPADPALVTELWKASLNYLPKIAQRHNVEFMLWGDKMLAPGEAPDAALGHNKKESAARRDVVPKGAYIADWHYLNNPDPKVYTSLSLFKSIGLKPIASGWNRPGNIAGFARAAAQTGSGYLQTVWAGFESSEPAMLREFDQFAAFVLAADYSWSARAELPSAVGYDPDREFYRRFYARPSVASAQTGFGTAGAVRRVIGAWSFGPMDPLSVASKVKTPTGPSELVIRLNDMRGRELALAIETQVKIATGDPVARVRVFSGAQEVGTGVIQYGYDVRSTGDTESTFRTARIPNGPSAWTLSVDNSRGPMTRVVIEPIDSSAGLRVVGVAGV